MKKVCIICNQEFETRDSRTVCCKKSDCRKQCNKLKYAKSTIERTCKTCGKSYLATRKQKHDCCPDCIKKLLYHYKEHVDQKHCCRQCGKIMYTECKNVTKNIPEVLYDITCDECKEKNRLLASERMMLNNPSHPHTTYNSVEEAKLAKEQMQMAKRKYKTKEDMKAAFSERMKINNPMFNKEIRQKVHDTLMARIANNEINYNWKNSPYYKGDRGIKNYIRLSLVWWRKANFERANYACECCGATGGYLHVHHTEKFSDIVERLANELNLDLKTLEYGSDEYKELEKQVNDYHKEHDIGLVVCENCHDQVDKCFHKRKLVGLTKNERSQNKKD